MRNYEQILTNIYEKNIWDRGSGLGSSYNYNKQYIIFLENFIKQNNIKNIIDLGCGDWQFSQHIDWSNVNYVGLDLVDSLIKKNNEDYKQNNIKFYKADIHQIEGIFQYLGRENQLILIKDVLQHWTDKEIINWLDKLLKLDFKFALITSGWKHYRQPEKNNFPRDINNKYSYAPLDFNKKPFNKYPFKHLMYYRFKEVVLYENRL